MLQLILAILKPSSGSVRVFDDFVPYHDVESFRRRIGYAVQGAGLFPHMTVHRNITLLAIQNGVKVADIDRRMTELFALVDLDWDLRDRYPYELSGGQRHRAGLCRALMLEPDLVLLDEVFAGIDPIVRREIQLQFQKIQHECSFSTVFVTHDIAEAKLLSDYIVIVENGQIVQQGATSDIFANPEPSIVKPLLATIQ